MRQVNIHEAKTHLSRLLVDVEGGEEILLARAGRPVARLVPLEPVRANRQLGQYRGERFVIADDFDELPVDIAEAFGS